MQYSGVQSKSVHRIEGNRSQTHLKIVIFWLEGSALRGSCGLVPGEAVRPSAV